MNFSHMNLASCMKNTIIYSNNEKGLKMMKNWLGNHQIKKKTDKKILEEFVEKTQNGEGDECEGQSQTNMNDLESLLSDILKIDKEWFKGKQLTNSDIQMMIDNAQFVIDIARYSYIKAILFAFAITMCVYD